MARFLHILGCRPHLIKFSQINDDDIVVWTGQHYDLSLKDNLIKEFQIKIDYDLAEKTLSNMISSIELVLEDVEPDCVIVYGDTRSTLAGALAAKEAGIKLVHVEAGVRSLKNNRYEERTRRAVDSFSDYLFCATKSNRDTLVKEGSFGKIFVVGDVHYDEYLKHRENNGAVLATIHREENIGTKKKLEEIIGMLSGYDNVFFATHPHTKEMLKKFKIKVPQNINIIEPLGYAELLSMVKRSSLVITDSGGLVKEATYAGTPVVSYGLDEWNEDLFRFGRGNAKIRIKEILLTEFK